VFIVVIIKNVTHRVQRAVTFDLGHMEPKGRDIDYRSLITVSDKRAGRWTRARYSEEILDTEGMLEWLPTEWREERIAIEARDAARSSTSGEGSARREPAGRSRDSERLDFGRNERRGRGNGEREGEWDGER